MAKENKKSKARTIAGALFLVAIFGVLGAVFPDSFKIITDFFSWTLPNLDEISRWVIGSGIGVIFVGFGGLIRSFFAADKWPGKGFSGVVILAGILSLAVLLGTFFLDVSSVTRAVASLSVFVWGFGGHLYYLNKRRDLEDGNVREILKSVEQPSAAGSFGSVDLHSKVGGFFLPIISRSNFFCTDDDEEESLPDTKKEFAENEQHLNRLLEQRIVQVIPSLNDQQIVKETASTLSAQVLAAMKGILPSAEYIALGVQNTTLTPKMVEKMIASDVKAVDASVSLQKEYTNDIAGNIRIASNQAGLRHELRERCKTGLATKFPISGLGFEIGLESVEGFYGKFYGALYSYATDDKIKSRIEKIISALGNEKLRDPAFNAENYVNGLTLKQLLECTPQEEVRQKERESRQLSFWSIAQSEEPHSNTSQNLPSSQLPTGRESESTGCRKKYTEERLGDMCIGSSNSYYLH